MKKALALVALMFTVGYSQFWSSGPANYTGIDDTSNFGKFSADSLKYSKAFATSDFENKCLLIAAVDTNSAVFATDSVKFWVGYQRGYLGRNALGKVDTTWRATCWMDTFDLKGTNKIITATTATTTDQTLKTEVLTTGLLDTTCCSGYAVLSVPYTPWWSPVERFVIKGQSGNRVNGWVKVIAQLSQRSYVPMRGK